MTSLHGLTEIFQMVGKALFLLADVQFLNIIDEFLLHTVLVVIHFGNRVETVDNLCTVFSTRDFS